MKLNEVKIGDTLEILIKRNSSTYRTVSKIEYADERFIGVSPIASKNGLFKFDIDDEIDLIYQDKDKYWQWEGVKAGVAKRKDGSRLHVFSSIQNAVRVNRRTQFRFEVGTEIKMKYEVMKQPLDIPEEERTPNLDLEKIFMTLDDQYDEVECRGYLKDLSEGGASVQSDVHLSKGMFVSFRIDSEIGEVYLRGVIIRAREDKRGYFDYTYGISFVETSKNYMRYFYLQQRKQLYEKNDQ